ncbi:MAG: mechanosensitive ion channel family protein [Propionibacteriaceae bacterium]|jgi:small conductance mechanosensitive channel|nr:mechanosensitive ion channel family protein [Propionibacteriaceae bacterium]
MLLELTWLWPDTLITICTIIALAIIAHVVVLFGIRQLTTRVIRIAKPTRRIRRKAAAALGTDPPLSSTRAAQHMTTIGQLLRSVWTIVLVVVVILTILSQVGIPLTPILTSAGIGGVVIAFGAQSLIKDYLSGVIMLLEGQFAVGDQVDVGAVKGRVEGITLRLTKLRDEAGNIWYIRHGEVQRIGNMSQGVEVSSQTERVTTPSHDQTERGTTPSLPPATSSR